MYFHQTYIIEKKNQKANNREGEKIQKKWQDNFAWEKTFEFKIVTLLPSWQAGC